MPIVAKAGASYTPAPAGAHAAVCVDVVDLGELEVTFGGKTKRQHKVNIVWQIEELRDDGKPHQLRKRYTLSLHEKAGLRKDLESWRGRPFNEEELAGFDVEVLIGKGCMINVVHNATGGNTYANVAAIMRMPKGMQGPTPTDYVRVCDREPENVPPADPGGDYGIDDSDIPF